MYIYTILYMILYRHSVFTSQSSLSSQHKINHLSSPNHKFVSRFFYSVNTTHQTTGFILCLNLTIKIIINPRSLPTFMTNGNDSNAVRCWGLHVTYTHFSRILYACTHSPTLFCVPVCNYYFNSSQSWGSVCACTCRAGLIPYLHTGKLGLYSCTRTSILLLPTRIQG